MQIGLFKRDNRIGKDHEVGPATLTVDRVATVRVSVVEMGSSRGRKMSACRKPPHANAVGIDTKFRRMCAYIPDGALCIAELDGMVVFRAQAIPKYKGRDAVAVQPCGNLVPLMINR